MVNSEGKKVFVGSMFNVRVLKSESIDDITDFTKDSSSIMFPSEVTLKKEVEVIEESLIGIPTSLKFLGKSKITGDITDITTPNGVLWYAANTLGGVAKSMENTRALITIESEGKFVIEAMHESGALKKITISKDGEDDFEIDILENTTVNDFISEVNKSGYFFAVLHIGDGSEIFTFEKDVIHSNIIEHLFVGSLSENYKKTIAKYIHVIIPKRGEPSWFNMLVGSDKAGINCQYSGCRLLKLNINYANNSLTKISSSIWAAKALEFSGTPMRSMVDDVKGAYSQTGGRTTVYSSMIKAQSVSSITNNFEFSVEQKYNIENEAYSIPVMKYTDSYDFEMLFNSESKNIFETRVLENKNISVTIASKSYSNGKEYHMIKYAKTLLGQPQYPSIAEGIITLSAAGFTSLASMEDPYTSVMIISGDTMLAENYSIEEIKKDFPEYKNL